MKTKPLLSVVIPVYNVEAYLSRCVDSVLDQTYDSLEIILVNDGSTDASGAICDAYAEKDSRVRVIHKENGGLSSARNTGLDAATGEYIAFLDSDDWVESDAYEHMLAVMEKYEVKLVCGGRYDVDGRSGERKIGLCPKKEERITGEELAGRIFLWDNCDSSACDKLYHRSLLDGFRYPEGRVCEDVPVTYRIALQAGCVAMSDRPFYNYYHRPGSISMSSFSEKTLHFSSHTAEIYPFIRDHYPSIQNQARYQRIRSLTHVLLLLDSADRETRKKWLEQYRKIHRQLIPHTGFFLRSNYFGKKEKITYFLLVLGMYRFLKPIFTKRKAE